MPGHPRAVAHARTARLGHPGHARACPGMRLPSMPARWAWSASLPNRTTLACPSMPCMPTQNARPACTPGKPVRHARTACPQNMPPQHGPRSLRFGPTLRYHSTRAGSVGPLVAGVVGSAGGTSGAVGVAWENVLRGCHGVWGVRRGKGAGSAFPDSSSQTLIEFDGFLGGASLASECDESRRRGVPKNTLALRYVRVAGALAAPYMGHCHSAGWARRAWAAKRAKSRGRTQQGTLRVRSYGSWQAGGGVAPQNALMALAV